MRLEEFKRLNAEKGYYFFERDTMRFFKSRLNDWDYVTGYFITSERRDDYDRKYTVRKADFENGNVRLISEFQKFDTIGKARTYWRNLLRGRVSA